MGQLKGLVGALIGGAVGAAIWAGVSLSTGYEIGWIAWGVGLLCGLGAMLLAQRDADDMTGVIAAVVALASVAGGKYLTVHYMAQEFTKIGVGAIEATEADAQAHMAKDIAAEYLNEGRTLKWDDGKSERTARALDDYPADLRKDLQARWDSMSESAQREYIGSVQAAMHRELADLIGQKETEGFFASFHALDLLFFFLAVVTAYKVGTGDLSGGDDD